MIVPVAVEGQGVSGLRECRGRGRKGQQGDLAVQVDPAFYSIYSNQAPDLASGMVDGAVMTFADLTLDPSTREVHRGMRSISLTRTELSLLMAGCGIPVKYHHHEGGRYSQVEVESSFMPAQRAADGIMLTKYLARNLAFRHDKTVTFMPKPIFGEAGSGMHVHMLLLRGGVSLFGDPSRENRLSELASYYMGGILHHAPSLCALTNPSTNSYRRLVPGYEAPVLVFFSFANRTAAETGEAGALNPATTPGTR